MASPRRSPRFKTSPVEIVLDSPAPKIQQEIIPMESPTKKIPSMVIRVKNATRAKKVPSKYEGFSTSLNWPKNSAYKLTKEETDLLAMFLEDCYERFDYLAKVCISPNPKRLKRLISREWLDTGILYNWFDICLKRKAPHTYFIDTNASDIWLREDKHNYLHIFGEYGWRVGEMQKNVRLSLFQCVIWSTSQSSWDIEMQKDETTTIVCQGTRDIGKWLNNLFIG